MKSSKIFLLIMLFVVAVACATTVLATEAIAPATDVHLHGEGSTAEDCPDTACPEQASCKTDCAEMPCKAAGVCTAEKADCDMQSGCGMMAAKSGCGMMNMKSGCGMM